MKSLMRSGAVTGNESPGQERFDLLVVDRHAPRRRCAARPGKLLSARDPTGPHQMVRDFDAPL